MATDKKLIAKERMALKELLDVLVPKRQLDENVLIATWNIAHFSNRKSARSLRYIADICERFDLIALQEVKSDLRGLSRLQEMLPGRYRILVSDPTGNAERMAFLYDSRTVVSTGLVCEVVFTGTIDEPETFQFNRSPYCASFKAGRFDFIVASVHIVEGSGKGAKGKEIREKEIRRFVNFIKKRATQNKGKVFDPDFIVVGDFNIQRAGDVFFNALTELPKPQFTMPGNMDNLKTNYGQTKTYDKIAWLPSETFQFTGECGCVPFGDVIYGENGDPEEARKRVSDHLPLWAEFEVTELQHELHQIINR